MGFEVSIKLPNKWYKDDTLQFALFFNFVPLDVDDETIKHDVVNCQLSISQGDQFIWVDSIYMVVSIYGGDKGLDILGLYFFQCFKNRIGD